MNLVSNKSFKTSFPCQVAAAECYSDGRIRDDGEMQQYLISNLFSNTDQSVEADYQLLENQKCRR